MYKTIFIFLSILFISITCSCFSNPSLLIGGSLDGELYLTVTSNGQICLLFADKQILPLMQIVIGEDLVTAIPKLNRHSTYVEIFDRNSSRKYIFELKKVNEEFRVNTKYETDIKIVNKQFSTVITIDSDEIGEFIRIAPDTDPKPDFPRSPIKYFALCRAVEVDWSINNIGDFFADVLFVIGYIILFIIDLVIIIILFVIRLIIFLFILLFYFIRSMFGNA